jgi:hypothetical protein
MRYRSCFIVLFVLTISLAATPSLLSISKTNVIPPIVAFAQQSSNSSSSSSSSIINSQN